jgi:hypothetical protein
MAALLDQEESEEGGLPPATEQASEEKAQPSLDFTD